MANRVGTFRDRLIVPRIVRRNNSFRNESWFFFFFSSPSLIYMRQIARCVVTRNKLRPRFTSPLKARRWSLMGATRVLKSLPVASKLAQVVIIERFRANRSWRIRWRHTFNLIPLIFCLSLVTIWRTRTSIIVVQLCRFSAIDNFTYSLHV